MVRVRRARRERLLKPRAVRAALAGLLAVTLNGVSPLAPAPLGGSVAAVGGQVTAVSTSTGGSLGDGPSEASAVSADGRYVAFASLAGNLVPGDTNDEWDIFRKDRSTGTVALVTVADGGGSSNGFSYGPTISDDGRYVAFESSATNLVAGDTNARSDIFVRDLLLATAVRVSVSSAGTQSNNLSSNANLSGNGQHVAFHSSASNLVSGDGNGATDVFVRDLAAATTTRVSVSSAGVEGNASSFADAISDDGQIVAMSSNASNLVANDTNVRQDIFVHDRSEAETTRVSVASFGPQANNGSDSADLSSDGRFVVFESVATNLVTGDTNGENDIFRHDRAVATTVRVSLDLEELQTDAGSFLPSISGDGNLVAFESPATNLVAGPDDGLTDIFLRRIPAGTTERLSTDAAGVEANGPAFLSSISSDGSVVTFDSSGSNLAPNDTNGSFDVFAKEVLDGPTELREAIFLHGITTSADDVRFDDLLPGLVAEFPGRVRVFQYVQDKAPQGCAGPIALPEEPNGGMPFDADSANDNVCDSQSDVGLNAVKLGNEVRAAYLRSGRPVILIGFSMGGAIIRGLLAYSAERGDGVIDMIDSAFFLETPHDGSLQFRWMVEESQHETTFVGGRIADVLMDSLQLDPTRPAVVALWPQSAWLNWVNPEPSHLPDVPYFNAFGDIRITEERCTWIWCTDEPKVLWHMGDMAIGPGSDDPFDVPAQGGAAMLSSALGPENWQWRLRSDVEWSWWGDPLWVNLLAHLVDQPQFHHQFPERIDEIMVEDCKSHLPTPLNEQLLDIIRGRLNGLHYDCVA